MFDGGFMNDVDGPAVVVVALPMMMCCCMRTCYKLLMRSYMVIFSRLELHRKKSDCCCVFLERYMKRRKELMEDYEYECVAKVC